MMVSVDTDESSIRPSAKLGVGLVMMVSVDTDEGSIRPSAKLGVGQGLYG